MTLKKLWMGLAASAALGLATTAAHAIPIELGLALDASGSISTANFALQRNAYATVLNDPTVLPRDGSVAIGVYQFSSSANQVFPTTVIDGTTIGNLITAISTFTRISGGTDIGSAITALQNDILGNAIDSDRQVIDVSTDGAGSLGSQPGAALAAGIEQINCLGIGAGANCGFIGGTDAFSITVASFGDFEQALRTKLAREIPGGNGTVPEPGMLALLGIGAAAFGFGHRKNKARTELMVLR